MQNQIKILWIGPIVPKNDAEKFINMSQASINWQNNMINGISKVITEIITLSYIPESYFPRGRLFPNIKSNNNIKYCDYINIPIIRNISLYKNIIEEIKNNNDANYVITYNSIKAHVVAANYARKKYGMKWINIVADDDHVVGPDLTVYLSYGYFKSSNISNKIHIDGGIESTVIFKNDKVKKKDKKIILYCGNINKWTGIESFAIEYSKLKLVNVELHIYGKGGSTRLKRLTTENSNIKLMGFVSNEVLDEAMMKCDAFVNPRPLDLKGSDKNFPSKILHYLKYAKPVMSTRVKGLAPHYDKIIYYYDPKNGNSIKKTIEKIIHIDNEDKEKNRLSLVNFTKQNTWDDKAEVLIDRLLKI